MNEGKNWYKINVELNVIKNELFVLLNYILIRLL